MIDIVVEDVVGIKMIYLTEQLMTNWIKSFYTNLHQREFMTLDVGIIIRLLLILSLSPDELELLYSTLTAMCIEYEDAIEATSDSKKKSQYRDFRLQTKNILEKIEMLKP